MKGDRLLERREETYNLLYRHGVDYSEAVQRLSDSYGVSKSAIRKDVSRMPSWISDINANLGDGLLRVAKVRDQHQDLEEVALEARRDGDLETVIRARKAIVQSLRVEDRMAARLGLTPDDAETAEDVLDPGGSLDPEDEDLIEEFCGLEGDPVDLEDAR